MLGLRSGWSDSPLINPALVILTVTESHVFARCELAGKVKALVGELLVLAHLRPGHVCIGLLELSHRVVLLLVHVVLGVSHEAPILV